MKTHVYTAQGKLWEDNAKEVVLPGEDGEFSVWDFHQDCVYRLRAGHIKIRPQAKQKGAKAAGEKIKIPIKRGIAGVRANRFFLLVETA